MRSFGENDSIFVDMDRLNHRYELTVTVDTVLDNLTDDTRIENIVEELLRPRMD